MIRDDIQQTKLEKLARIREFGMDPYPEKNERTYTNIQIVSEFEKISGPVTIVGRVRSLRPMGGSAFANIEDETGKMQLFLNKGNMSEELFKLFVKNVELGDFVQVIGELFLTKTGEKSLKVTEWKMLSKNIRPIPTEHFGIKDEEELLRRRYLDLMTNADTRELFRKKNIFWQTVRNFLAEDGFLEVQNPVFELTPGGADAEPFLTHHNALDQDFYMRISLELALKRLLVGGYEKVFEIGRVFRNEGIDRHHLQEYDAMEFYAAYWDLQKGMEFSQKLYKEIAFNVLGTYEHVYEGNIINWNVQFPVVDFFEAFEKETGINLSRDISVEQLMQKADELGIKYEKSYGKGRMIDTIYKKTVRQKMIQPCFLVGHPIEVSPLAKKDPRNPKKVLRFQIVAGTAELCNAFAELNDPIDQRARFEEQMRLREAGDSEAQMIDEDFVEALEYGMPPAFGFGLSERVFSFLVNKSIRECVIFPPMKEKEAISNSNETKIAVAIINKGADMEPWQKMNAIAHLNAAFAARKGKALFLQDEIVTKDQQKIKLNIKHAIMIREASSSEELAALAKEAKKQDCEVAEFTREMIETTNDKIVIEKTREKDLKDVEFLGVLVFGNKKNVEKLTSEFPLAK